MTTTLTVCYNGGRMSEEEFRKIVRRNMIEGLKKVWGIE